MCGVVLAAANASAAPDYFSRELESRRQRFEREGGKPQAVVPLLDVLELWELLPDRAPIVQFLDEAAASAKARPDVRARAAFLRSLAYDRQGHEAEAQKTRAALGMITRWWMVGPFDNEGKAGHAAVYPPERELATASAIDPKATFEGKDRPVAWRLLPEISTSGMVPLDAVLRPDSQVTAYLTVAVRSSRAQKIAVRAGSTGAIKVWVDGRLALDDDVYRPIRFDQDAGPAELAAGWNRVTVKLSSGESGGARLFLRLSQPNGAPLDGVELSTELARLAEAPRPKANPAAKPERAFAGAVAHLGRELQALAKKSPRDAQLLSDWGTYLRALTPEDPEQHHAEEVLADAARLAPSAAAFLRLAQAQADPNDQRKALDEGLLLKDQDPSDRAQLYARLGDLLSRARRERRAEAMWRAALTADSGYFPAAVALAEMTADRGVPARAAAELDVLAKAHPALKVLRAQASLAFRRGHRVEAEKLLARVLDGEHNDDDAITELFAAARGRGAVDAALGWLDRLERVRPDLLSVAADRADLLDGVGRVADAERALAAALDLAPDDAKLLERDGRLLHRLSRDAEALEKLRRALALHPQNPELRAYVAELEARGDSAHAKGQHADLAAAWATDVKALIARVRADKTPPPSGLPARVLYDQEVTRVHSNGLSETFQQRVIEILDSRGAREQGDFDIRFTPDTQSVELRAARVHRPDGEVIEAVSTEEQNVSEPWYGMYYDVRAQTIRFSALQPNDVIDVEYVIADVARRNMFADYFGDLHFFQEAEMPRVEQRYVLIAPKSRTLYFNTPRMAGLARTDETVGDEKIYKFTVAGAPKLESEPGMPGFSELAGYVHVSTYRTWEDVSVWYQGLIKSQLEPSSAITAAVKEATRGITDERAKIRAIYDLVVKKTRYVALEFGIHGYQPYRVAQIFARKFGDCKDKASLLVVMLKQAGIDATLVLARTRSGGDLDPEPASLAPFDHAIAYVPKYGLYLDGTAEFSGSDELPAQDQDIPVLQVSAGKLVRTPVLPAARNHVNTDWRVRLDASGAAAVDEQITIAGEAAHEWRSHYQSPGERLERYGRAWNGKHPGAKIAKLEMSVDDLEKPVEARAAIEVPHWARPQADAAGAQLVMPALGREADMLRSFARLSSRKHDLILGYPWAQQERVTVTLPAGFRARRLPEARTVEAPFGKFALAVEARAGEVVTTATLQIDRHRIAQADYAAFRKFCAEVDAAVAQELVVGGEAAAKAAVR